MGDTVGYKVLSRQLDSAYKTEPGTARTLALSPAADCDSVAVADLAERQLTVDERDAEFLHILGMAYYRANRFDEAIATCRESIEFHAPASPINYPVLAMAQFGLELEQDARVSIQEADTAYDTWLSEMVDHFEPFWQIHYGAEVRWPIDRLDWLEFQLLHREAHTLLGLPVTDDPRLHILRARGFAGLRRTEESVAEYEIALQSLPHNEQLRLEKRTAFAACRSCIKVNSCPPPQNTPKRRNSRRTIITSGGWWPSPTWPAEIRAAIVGRVVSSLKGFSTPAIRPLPGRLSTLAQRIRRHSTHGTSSSQTLY